MTVRQALIKHLEPSIAKVAIQRATELNNFGFDYVDREMGYRSSEFVLGMAFVWEDSPEGKDYWEALNKQVKWAANR